MSMPTACSPLKTAAGARLLGAVVDASATSPSRTTRPCDCATTSCSNSAGVSRRPRRRIVRSSICPLRRPTGTARFCDCSACTTCATLTPAVCSRVGRSSTVSSRSTPPTTSTSATPGMPRSSLVMPGSASCVSSAPVSFVRRQRQRDDRQVGRIEARQDRLLHLERQLVADLRDLVANVLRRLLQVLLELEDGDDHAEAVQRVRLDLLDAADPGDALLDAIDQLALDALRRRARIRQRHDDHRVLHVGELVGLELHQREDAEDDEREHRRPW